MQFRFFQDALGTAGGIAINKDGQALDWNDKPIPGLYQQETLSGCVLGWGYPGGGSTIGPALTMGYLAGKAINKQ